MPYLGGVQTRYAQSCILTVRTLCCCCLDELHPAPAPSRHGRGFSYAQIRVDLDTVSAA